ncbi:S1 family peptidase [Spongiactinospora sp. TRM90649]|uniref:S1 family peptidase n=1 Tax=Spongiactinospora sp. TRM90649 TaxID=3031114 RepID=UPI0023F64B60|nr:S1 family peptidase [Spongiactinospora sp. TRM90649]MDF5756431.1 S1 family peptidase [Spongiactinospora sp. TRM90649]
MHRTPLTVASLALTAVALTLTATPAQARPSSGPESGMVAAMARDLGLSPAGASARLAAEERAQAIEPGLRAGLGERFGGSWVTGTGALVVATTRADDVAAVTARGARAQVVGRSLAALDAVKAGLDRTAVRGSVWSWFVDVVSNQVVIQSGDVADGEAFVRASGVDRAAVRVERAAERPSPHGDIRGGDPIRIGANSRCVVGFSVRKGAKQGFVSAGHCGRPGDLVYPPLGGTAIGVVEGSSFPSRDYLWASLYPGWNATGYVNSGGLGLRPIRGANEAAVGSSVCSVSPVTGWRCGTIQQRNATVTYPGGTVFGLTRTNVCSEPGGSGAPFVSGDQAQGVASGGSGNCSSGGTTYFQPIRPALTAYRLTLVTAVLPTLPPSPASP